MFRRWIKTGSEQPVQKQPTDWKAELRSIVLIILGIMSFKSFAYSNHDIPSDSMLPGLMTGDYIIVSRFAYGYSRYSTPLVPLPSTMRGRIFFSTPKRGDVVVFRFPGDDSMIYIKRLIGLPGDTIEIHDGQLFLNGAAVPKTLEGTRDIKVEPNYACRDGVMAPYLKPDGTCSVPLYRETLPGGKSYFVYDLVQNAAGDNFGPAIVPKGHYFMLGDNRDNSIDSRWPVNPASLQNGIGFLPEDHLVGRAEFIYLSTNGKGPWYQPWKWPQTFRTDRLFDKVK